MKLLDVRHFFISRACVDFLVIVTFRPAVVQTYFRVISPTSSTSKLFEGFSMALGGADWRCVALLTSLRT